MVLSFEQLQIQKFLESSDESLLIQALAGTGKTTTLIKVVLPTLLKKGILEKEILVLMFSKPVNVEFEKRLKQEKLKIRSATFHSASYRLLQDEFGTQIDFDKNKKIANELGIESDELIKLASLCKIHGVGVIQDLPMNAESIKKIAEHHGLPIEEWEISLCAKYLIKSFEQKEFCDFDDMIWLAVGYQLKGEYKYVVVDELQDNSDLRNAFITQCCGNCTFIGVGDRHQAIYSFTGSNHKSMDKLKEHFNASELPLSVTFRCSRAVTEFAKKWAPTFKYRDNAPFGKVQEMTFGNFYKQRIPQDSAILCRLNSPLLPLAFTLANSGQKCFIKGRAIGEELINLSRRWKWNNVNELEPKVKKFLERQKIRLLPDKESEYKNIVDKCNCLFSVINHCQDNNKTSKHHFENYFKQIFADQGEGIVLISAHGSKGLEFNNVYIWGWNTLMPAKWAKKDWEHESEKCLQFVAVTRAINNLYLIS